MLLDLLLTRTMRRGSVTVTFPDGTTRRYGDGVGPATSFAVRTGRAARRLVLDPGLGFGEAYMDGGIEPGPGEDIYSVLDALQLNLGRGGPHPADRLVHGWRRLRRRVDQLNPAWLARRRVAHHYDLDGRLYERFLDADRQYSCAYFPTGGETLAEAQAAKKRHVAAKLLLDRPGLEVLDIGCGWGGMALTLARDYGARVTGITLSREQLDWARARAVAEGLDDRVSFELMDFRAWTRPVDRVVSVGMFEHVGLAQYPAFFRTVRGALREDGVALVHAIGRRDGPGATNAWLAKYVFPGGYAPALSEVLPAVERGGLWVTDLEVLRLHYAETIRHWRANFAREREAIRGIYDERFCRMFEFYLAGCELAFRRLGHMVWQVQLARRQDAVPLTRDYITAAEHAPEPAAG